MKAFLIITLLLMNGCGAVKIDQRPENGIVVQGDKIYFNDKVFAELRYFSDEKHGTTKGIGIYYFVYGKEVWIYPKEGWSLLMDDHEYKSIPLINELWNEYRKKEYAWIYDKGAVPEEKAILLLGGQHPPKIQPRVWNIHISEDGRFVYYTAKGFLFDSTQKYSVEYDSLKK